MIAWFEGHVSDGSIRGLTASLCIMDGVLLGMEYDLRWQYHAGIALGVAFYFL